MAATETLSTTVNIVLPLFLLIVLGWGLRQVGVLNEAGCAGMNVLAFQVLVPAMVFYNIYQADLAGLGSLRVLAFAAISVTAVFLLLLVVVPRLERDPARVGVLIQGTFRSSFVVLGMGLAASMYPGADLSLIAVTSTVVAPLFNAYSVIALEVFSGGKADPKGICLGVMKNPLILASMLALVMLLGNIRLPYAMEMAVKNISATATTLSLIILGGGLSFAGIGQLKKQMAFALLGKLVVLPLVFVSLAVAMGFREIELLCILILFGSPTTVTSHIMAVNSGGDGQLAGQIVVFSTTLSVVTLFGFIYLLLSWKLL